MMLLGCVLLAVVVALGEWLDRRRARRAALRWQPMPARRCEPDDAERWLTTAVVLRSQGDDEETLEAMTRACLRARLAMERRARA